MCYNFETKKQYKQVINDDLNQVNGFFYLLYIFSYLSIGV